MAQKVKIDGLAEAVMKELTEYADLATVDMKAAVKKAGNTVKKQIQSTAPKDTGAYSKSWSVKNTKETSKSLEVTVYSRNRYQLAHLLEFGHAKRGGGRVAGRSHIVPAEEAGIKELESEIERLFFIHISEPTRLRCISYAVFCFKIKNGSYPL